MVQAEEPALVVSASNADTQTLGIAWWNTALSPTAKPGRASQEERQTAADMVSILCALRHHFIALGEIDSTELEALSGLTADALQGYTIVDASSDAGHSKFDTAVLYRSAELTLRSRQDLLSSRGTRVRRLGQRFQMIVNDDGSTLDIFVSHWPSRLYLHEDRVDRIEFGLRLRDQVDLLLSSDPATNVILLGDYNDEPFDSVIAEGLRATRDKRLVARRPELLYNPFWRHMSSYEHGDPQQQALDPGTYFYTRDDLTRWRTFDHMMFSSSLVHGTSGWLLDEHKTRVLDVPLYTDMVRARRHIFDHLPITTQLLRSQSNA